MHYTMIKQDGHLRTQEKCRKHEPQVHNSGVSVCPMHAKYVFHKGALCWLGANYSLPGWDHLKIVTWFALHCVYVLSLSVCEWCLDGLLKIGAVKKMVLKNL